MRLGDWGTGGLSVLAVLALFAGCNQTEAEEQAAGPELAVVETRDLNVTAEASGLVEPIQTVEIKSKASGEVVAVQVETGQEVKRGALLVAVDPRDVRNALAQAQADLEVAKARAMTSAANLKRVQELRKTNVATEQEMETAVLDEANARAQLVKAQTNLDLARERMNDVTIRAPLDGTIIEKTIEPGSIIASASGTFGGGTTLLKMADLAVVRVRALVDQTDIGRVQAGQVARVTVEAYPGRPFTGEVVKVEPQAVVEQNVTMFPVLVHLRNDERLLRPGMNTEVEIEIAERNDVAVIPNDAVVAMRDATTAGTALGLSEEQMREAMSRMRRPPSAGAVAVAVAGRSAGAGAGASPECSALREKVRAGGGPDALSDAERAKLRECRQGGSGRPGVSPGSQSPSPEGPRSPVRGTTRRGLVFVPGESGPEPRMVTLGVNDWDYTEVLSGLQPGDKVFLMTAARLQQQQLDIQTRIRDRSNMGMRQSESQQQQQSGGGQRSR